MITGGKIGVEWSKEVIWQYLSETPVLSYGSVPVLQRRARHATDGHAAAARRVRGGHAARLLLLAAAPARLYAWALARHRQPETTQNNTLGH